MVMKKKMKKRVAMAVTTGMVAASTVGGLSVSGVAAELTDSDTIDMTKTATLEIHKYDEVAARMAGVDVSSLKTADGEDDADVESAMAKYALKGVQFTYLKVGDIITDTDEAEAGANASVGVVYSVESDLMNILGLQTKDAKKTVTSGNQTKYCFSSTQINEALAEKLETSYLATKDALEDYIQSGNHRGTALEDTDTSGETSKSGLELGLYLIIETEVPEEVICTTDPFFVSLPMTDATGDYWIQDDAGNYKVTVYPKNQTDVPTINKVVRQVKNDANDTENFEDITTASEGDRLEYRIASKVPVVTTDASNYTAWTYEDLAASGITYDQKAGVTIKFYDTEEEATDKDAVANVTWAFGTQVVTKTAYDAADTADRNKIMAYVDYAADGSGMSVILTPAGLEAVNSDTDTVDQNTTTSNSQYQGKYLTVCYSASVDSSADTILGDAGNINDVSLTYKRTNADYYEIIRDKANVYTYGIDLTKTFSEILEKGHSAKEVQFILKNNTNGQYVVAVPVKDSSGKTVDGQYYVTDSIDATTEADGTVFSPGENGKLLISGLEADEYILTEIRTVDGYSLLKDDIIIDIDSTVDSITPSKATRTGIDNPNAEVIYVNEDRASATVDAENADMTDGTLSTNEYVAVDVINTKNFLLPKTGGLGTLLFSVIAAGGCLAGIGVVKSGSNKKDERIEQ